MSEEWRAQARCRDTPKELFFPVAVHGKYDQVALAKAFAHCDACPVSDECYDFGRRDKERCGIWGGVILETATKRNRRARAAQKATPR